MKITNKKNSYNTDNQIVNFYKSRLYETVDLMSFRSFFSELRHKTLFALKAERASIFT